MAEDFKGSGDSAAVGEPEAPRRGGGLPLPALKYWRKRRELSQTELARRANLRIEYVFRVENGRRGCNPETAQLLADLLESGYARGYCTMHVAVTGAGAAGEGMVPAVGLGCDHRKTLHRIALHGVAGIA